MHLNAVHDSDGFEFGDEEGGGGGDGDVSGVVDDDEVDGFEWGDVYEGRGVHLLKRFQGLG